MANSLRSGEEVAPTQTGANDKEENSSRSDKVNDLSLRGEGRLLSPAASSAQNYGDRDGGHSAEFPHSDKEVAPL